MQNEQYSNTDILNLLYIHGECGRIVDRTCRVFNERYNNLLPMNKYKFRKIEADFLRFGINKKKSVPKPVTGNEDNQVNVLAYFEAHPHSSIPAASRDLGLSCSSSQRILRQHNMHPYSFVKLQALRPGDDQRRIEFCEMILTKIQDNPDFLSKIIWTDESKFSRDGVINRRNSHYWARENPHVVREANFQNGFSCNVFCLIMNNQIRYEIYDENLTSDRFLEILRGTVSEFLDELPLNILRDCWYQLDGAPAHSSRDVYLELTNMFEDRWIGRNGPWRWPPRSPDLTPLDFYLWGYIKSKVYETPVSDRNELMNRIRTAFRNLDRNQVFRAVTNDVNRRLLKCLEQNGGHIEHLYS